MIVVADASPLIYLSALGHLDVLRVLFERVLVPRAVFEEVVIAGEGEPGSVEVAAATWIDVRAPGLDHDLLAKLEDGIDPGEAAAIVLAMEVHAELIVMDDRLGRRQAEAAGLAVRGTLGILVEARRRHLIPPLASELERLVAAGFRVSQRALHDALLLVGE